MGTQHLLADRREPGELPIGFLSGEPDRLAVRDGMQQAMDVVEEPVGGGEPVLHFGCGNRPVHQEFGRLAAFFLQAVNRIAHRAADRDHSIQLGVFVGLVGLAADLQHAERQGEDHRNEYDGGDLDW